MKIIIIQLINYTLSFLMWMIVGRVLLTMMIGHRDIVLMRAFIQITEPIHRVTRKIVPFAKESCVPFISVLLILIVRFIIVIVFKPGTTR